MKINGKPQLLHSHTTRIANGHLFPFMYFLFQIGFAMVCAGCVRKKNIQNTLLKNLLDSCCASLAFFSVGYAFAFGAKADDDLTTKSFMGTSNFFLIGVDNLAFWFYEFVCAATAGKHYDLFAF
jgi:ammonium transporter, Amt family